MPEGELLQDQEQGPRLVLDDLAHHRGLVGLEPVLPLPLAGQEDEAGLVVVVVLDVGREHHAAVLLPRPARCRWPPRAPSSCATRSTALAVELAASTSRPGRLAAQPAAALGVGVGVRDHLGDLVQTDPGPGDETVPDGMPDLPHYLQVVDLVRQKVHGRGDRALDGVLDGHDGAVDLA